MAEAPNHVYLYSDNRRLSIFLLPASTCCFREHLHGDVTTPQLAADTAGLRFLRLVPSGIGAGADRTALAHPAPFPHKLPLAEQRRRHVNRIETAHIARCVDACEYNHAASAAAPVSLSCSFNSTILLNARSAHFARSNKSVWP